tara:strand:- start:1255 stop:1617 length:363 start_codon:yes stop_codon:yes gene_type:complete
MPKKKIKDPPAEEVVEEVAEVVEDAVQKLDEVAEEVAEVIEGEKKEEFVWRDDFCIDEKWGEDAFEDLLVFANDNYLCWDFMYQLMARGCSPETAKQKWRKVESTLKENALLGDLVSGAL